MQEILDYLITNWEVSILPTLLIICGIASVIIKRTSTKKDDEVLENVEGAIHEIDEIIKDVKDIKEKKNPADKDGSTSK